MPKGEHPNSRANLRPPFPKGNKQGGRPLEPWKQWLRSLEPEVREKWFATFRTAKPDLRVRMMERFFDRTHGTPTETVEVTGATGGALEIVVKHAND
jgi:hypothetical protein